MRLTGTGVAVSAMVAVSAFCVGAFGTGVADGSPRPAAKATLPGTFEMYANVDQLGDLGSNVGAKSVVIQTGSQGSHTWDLYDVTFKRPIGNCAAQAGSGFAGGNLSAGYYIPEVESTDSTTFRVGFLDPASGYRAASAFMLTVTCPS